MNAALTEYLRRIGRNGGKARSPAKLDAIKRNLEKAREARKAAAQPQPAA